MSLCVVGCNICGGHFTVCSGHGLRDKETVLCRAELMNWPLIWVAMWKSLQSKVLSRAIQTTTDTMS